MTNRQRHSALPQRAWLIGQLATVRLLVAPA